MEITLGPVLYEWPRERLFSFYEEAADMEVDRVVIGEVVCSRRRGLDPEAAARVAERLERAGKRVSIATLALVTGDDELDRIRELAALPWPLEANDMGAVAIAHSAGRTFHAGPHLECYNAEDLEVLRSLGAARFALPVELSIASAARIIERTGAEVELFAHGRPPLTFSWRCYTSRAEGLKKSNCAHGCSRRPSGMLMGTLDGEDAFVMNGTSVLGAATQTLVAETDRMEAAGVAGARISPEAEQTAAVAALFRRRLAGLVSAAEALDAAAAAAPPGGICNGWHRGAAGRDLVGRPGEEGRDMEVTR